MRRRSLAAVAAAVGGQVEPVAAEGTPATGAVVDSRLARSGDVFFALPGERTDGHAFVADATARGAVAAVVAGRAEVASVTGAAVIRVDDPARALLDLAADERSTMGVPVVGITGSTGKTCTKDLLAAVLGRRMAVTSSRASFNNEVGLPLTILGADAATQVLVCEMGARGVGHIRRLCQVARPTVGVVTNVGVAHLELFGSREAIREAKAELPEALPADGTAILNEDDAIVRSYAARTPARAVTFGRSPDADVRAEDVTVDAATGRATFRLRTPAGDADVRLAVPGEHMVSNALAAAAAALTLGLTPDDVAAGLAEASVSAGRMDVFEAGAGIRVIDDAYNANPTSMAAALKALRTMAAGARTVAVLGGMAELGPIAGEEHERVGELVARLGIDVLVAVGPDAARIAAGAEREGVEPGRVLRCADVSGALAAVAGVLEPGDLVLVKASRVEGLDRVADALREGSATPAARPADVARAGS